MKAILEFDLTEPGEKEHLETVLNAGRYKNVLYETWRHIKYKIKHDDNEDRYKLGQDLIDFMFSQLDGLSLE